MIDTIEILLEIEEADTDKRNFTSSVSSASNKTPSLIRNLSMRTTKNGKKPRKGKTLKDKSDKDNLINTGITLFANIHSQLLALLDKRHQLIVDISTTITRELISTIN